MEFEPGQALSRAELAAHYEVSQTPIRDAMLRLATEGLLEIFPQARTTVSLIDTAHAEQTQFLRLSLEVETAKALCETPALAPVHELQENLAAMHLAANAADMALFSVQDAAFHHTMFAAIGKEDLWHLVVERSGHIDRLRKLNLPDPGKVDQILRSHGEIIAGLEAGDSGLTESAIRRHLGETLARVYRIKAAYPHYF